MATALKPQMDVLGMLAELGAGGRPIELPQYFGLRLKEFFLIRRGRSLKPELVKALASLFSRFPQHHRYWKDFWRYVCSSPEQRGLSQQLQQERRLSLPEVVEMLWVVGIVWSGESQLIIFSASQLDPETEPALSKASRQLTGYRFFVVQPLKQWWSSRGHLPVNSRNLEIAENAQQRIFEERRTLLQQLRLKLHSNGWQIWTEQLLKDLPEAFDTESEMKFLIADSGPRHGHLLPENDPLWLIARA